MYTLEELPRNNKGIVWNKTKGMIVSMEYKGECYKVKIENVFIKNNKSCLSISNNDNKIDILAGNFIKGKIGNLIGKKTSFYLFNIGQKVQTSNSSYLEILELNRSKKQKSYKYRCPIDGYIGEISESDLKKGVSCSVCSNQKIIKGINDIATTHPHLVKYFVNKEDAYKYSYGSKIKVKVKCPNCGYLKSMNINKLISRNKMTCRKCSDGISYPEKFLYSILKQLNIDFETQKIFDWSRNLDNKKLYDFYFKYDNKKVIIETHGSQHYDEKGFENLKI